MTECSIVPDKNFLVVDEKLIADDLLSAAGGKRLCCKCIESSEISNCPPNSILYLTGDVAALFSSHPSLQDRRFFVVSNASRNFDGIVKPNQVIDHTQLPYNIFGVGIFFENAFTEEKLFDQVSEAHQFQSLKESNKPTDAFRTGIYLSHVTETEEGTRFNLLRCSSNFTGPTDGFRDVDRAIVGHVNALATSFFDRPAQLNHVLAQIYHNHTVFDEQGNRVTEKRAKIKDHSDKTKDMPVSGMIAFVSLYQTDKKVLKPSELTCLRFRLKHDVLDTNNPITGEPYEKVFDVLLSANSVFIIPLSTNRLYTHEIVPPKLPADQIPTRMGYVIRCSKLEAVHRDGQTLVHRTDEQGGGGLVPLVDADGKGVKLLKEIYYEENVYSKHMEYPFFQFSLNKGDYMKPNP